MLRMGTIPKHQVPPPTNTVYKARVTHRQLFTTDTMAAVGGETDVIQAYFDRVPMAPGGHCLYICIRSSLEERRRCLRAGARKRRPPAYVDPKALKDFVKQEFGRILGCEREKWGDEDVLKHLAIKKHLNVVVLTNARQSCLHNSVTFFNESGVREGFLFQENPQRVLALLQTNSLFLEWCIHGDGRCPNHYNLLVPKEKAETKLRQKVAAVQKALHVSPLSSPETGLHLLL